MQQDHIERWNLEKGTCHCKSSLKYKSVQFVCVSRIVVKGGTLRKAPATAKLIEVRECAVCVRQHTYDLTMNTATRLRTDYAVQVPYSGSTSPCDKPAAPAPCAVTCHVTNHCKDPISKITKQARREPMEPRHIHSRSAPSGFLQSFC